jgi:hypothetical protein
MRYVRNEDFNKNSNPPHKLTRVAFIPGGGDIMIDGFVDACSILYFIEIFCLREEVAFPLHPIFIVGGVEKTGYDLIHPGDSLYIVSEIR